MEYWILPRVLIIMVALNSFQAKSALLYPPFWLNIDCGSSSKHQDEINKDLTWLTDEGFIESGENRVLDSVNPSFLHMKTLRSFPNGSENCYKVPLDPQSKYLIRAGFLYGNYDNLKKPPTFALRIVGHGSVTVKISDVKKPVYHEFYIVTKMKEDITEICLIRTVKEHVPFISSLEATKFLNSAYKFLTSKSMLYLESRINYGANQSVPGRLNAEAEAFNRIWQPQEVPTYRSLSDDRRLNWPTFRTENMPPLMILWDAIVANDVSESIFLPVKFRQMSPEVTATTAYFVFYLAIVPDNNDNNISEVENTTSTVSIYIDGQLKNTTLVPYWSSEQECAVVTVYPVTVTGGEAAVTISAAGGSTLPPIINAMEVFSEVNKAVRYGFGGSLFFLIIYYFVHA